MTKILLIAFFFISALSFSAEASLVGQWTFDEPSGNIAYDSSGYGNDGTIYGAARTAGLFGNALSFDGLNDYVEIGDTSSLDISNYLTLEAWFRTTAAANHNNPIVSKDDDGSNREWYLGTCFDANNPGKVRWTLNTPNPSWYGYQLDSNTAVNDGLWHYIAATYDGSYMRLYIDGTEDSKSPMTRTGQIPNTQAHFRIGYTGSATTQYFVGTIDNVSVYNTALSADEISQQYNNSAAPVPEPATMLLFCIGGLAIVFLKSRVFSVSPNH